jgi:signal transduction histidine kinase
MAAAGGLIFSLYIRRRIESINQTCTRIMSGELTNRAVVSGSDDEFDHLAQNINAMLTRINELIDGIRDISYNVAHDLRTPLNRLRNRLERLETAQTTGQVSGREVYEALKDIDRLIATFDSILRIAQAEVGAGIEHFTDVDLSALVQDVVDLYAALAEEKQQHLTAVIENGITLKGDRNLLTQAFANLIDNAIKYTPQGGAIAIRLQAHGQEIKLEVADSGSGIPPEYHQKVKQKFFRLEQSRTSPGNGLGLSLADAAFQLHSATLTFSDNAPGLIATVTFGTRTA